MPSVEVRGQGAHGTTRVREQHHPSTLVQHWRERGRRSPKCSPDEESNQPSGSMQSSEAISAECGVLTSPPSTKRHARGIVDVAVRLKVRRVPPVMRSQSAQRHRRRPALHCRLTPRRRPLHCRLTSRRHPLHTHPRRRRARALGHRPEGQTAWCGSQLPAVPRDCTMACRQRRRRLERVWSGTPRSRCRWQACVNTSLEPRRGSQ